MPQQTKSGPDPAYPPTTGTLRAQLDDFKFETDFVELAERFAALSGGGFSREISADLALEVVLNEIVERACGATGATGAAIVLWRDGEMVCRASSGPTAPDMGTRLDVSTGLSGECVRTRQTQRSDDVLKDSRVDVETSFRLGLRSAIVMPLLRGEKLLGLFELLSSRPSAFEEKDELVLEALASRALSNLERASKPLPPPASQPVRDGDEVRAEGRRKGRRRRFDWVTWVLGASVVAAAVLLGVLVAQHFVLREGSPAAEAVPSQAASGNAAANSTQDSAAGAPATDKIAEGANDSGIPADASKPGAASAVPPGGLLVSEDGKEIFRMPPQNESGASSPAGQASSSKGKRMLELSPAEAEDRLLQRVEPEYPEQARQQQIQGAVVLQVQISKEGKVEDVQVVSGPPLLAQASIAAVKQWRFKPHPVGGHLTPMVTKITLNFRLPE